MLAGTVQAQRADPLEPVNEGTPRTLPQVRPARSANASDLSAATLSPSTSSGSTALPAPYRPSEFEKFVQTQGFPEIRRLGSDLVTGDADEPGADLSPLVPADYVISAGDEVMLALWGAVDANLQLLVDRSGRITIPRVGAVQVAGIRHADLQDVIARRVAQVYRNFEISASLGRLRGIRVFVTGYVQRPGAYSVSSLSTVVAALMRAGGPAGAGSFRNIELRRGATLVGRFDLYDLLFTGDRSGDRNLQAGDVVHIGKVGTQVGVVGSVNKPAIVELKPGEVLADALRYAGGFSAVADRTRLAIERLEQRLNQRINQLEMPRDERQSLSDGDLIRSFSAVDSVLSTNNQFKTVRVEGEVYKPGVYVLPESSSVEDAIKAAGGYTSAAFLFAAEFSRERVRVSQQENYDRALRDLEGDLQRSAAARRATTNDEVALQQANLNASSRLIERLRAVKPTGRIVLDLTPQSTKLPDLALEDGDRIYIPAKATTVGVFGSVFNAAAYLYIPERTLEDYIRLAGGVTKAADDASTFVIRANGQVLSNRQYAGLFSRTSSFGRLRSEAGDTIFVPEEQDRTTFVQASKDWTLLLYQLGVGLAGLKSAFR